MANTVTKLGGVVDISAIDSNWLLSDTFDVPDGVYVRRIKYFGTAGDRLIVRHGSITGPVLTVLKTVDGSGLSDLIDMDNCIPCIKYSECTISAGSHIVITGKNGLLF